MTGSDLHWWLLITWCICCEIGGLESGSPYLPDVRLGELDSGSPYLPVVRLGELESGSPNLPVVKLGELESGSPSLPVVRLGELVSGSVTCTADSASLGDIGLSWLVGLVAGEGEFPLWLGSDGVGVDSFGPRSGLHCRPPEIYLISKLKNTKKLVKRNIKFLCNMTMCFYFAYSAIVQISNKGLCQVKHDMTSVSQQLFLLHQFYCSQINLKTIIHRGN